MTVFPRGFLGTEADVLVDTIIVAIVLVVPALLVSWRLARRGRYTAHRNIQLSLAAALGVALALFEYDLYLLGGAEGLFAPSVHAGSAALNGLLRVHLSFSISTAVIWVTLIASSLWRFPNPPTPNAFSRAHRLGGWAGMLGMIGTGITGLALYLLAFVYG